MTTEICILNKSAAVLAADSAVTVQRSANAKVYNTANKVFALSKFTPVGIMIYGNSSIMGVPWETIIKMYRRQLSNTKLPTIRDYCTSFFNYVAKFNYDISNYAGYFEQVAYEVANELRAAIDNDICRDKFTETQILNLLEQKIANASNNISEQQLADVDIKKIKDKLAAIFPAFIDKISKLLPLSQTTTAAFIDLILKRMISLSPHNYSGIVIAGFGEDEILPSLSNYRIGAVIEQTCIYENLGNHNGAGIFPFAQIDDIRAFIEGISPKLRNFLASSFEAMMTQLTENLAVKINEWFGGEPNSKIIENINDICNGASEILHKQVGEYQRNEYIDPIINTTEILNKEELANMAETLINMVSFRKQVTLTDETVGGPIDVAVITKGDGLIWIKRKHYFDPQLNQHFFANYHRELLTNGE